MDENRIIKQNAPENILWWLFRIRVEEEIVPEEMVERNRAFVMQIFVGRNDTV